MTVSVEATGKKFSLVRYISQVEQDSLLSIQTPRAIDLFKDPKIAMLESRICVKTVDGISVFGDCTGSNVWTQTPLGLEDHVYQEDSPPAHLGYMTWTRTGVLSLACGPELIDGNAQFSIFVTRRGAMMSCTGEGRAHSQGPKTGPTSPFKRTLGLSWHLGVMIVARRASNHEMLPVVAGIHTDLGFHHEVMSSVLGHACEVDRLVMLPRGPWPIPI